MNARRHAGGTLVLGPDVGRRAPRALVVAYIVLLVAGACTASGPTPTGHGTPEVSPTHPVVSQTPGVRLTPSPQPSPTACVPDFNGPLPVSWSDVLPAIPPSSRWSLEFEAADGEDGEALFVDEAGRRVGAIYLLVYSPCAWSSYDFEHGGATEVRRAATSFVASMVEDRWNAQDGFSAVPEPISEVVFGGRSGFRMAFSDVEIATGHVVFRSVKFWASEGRGLWTVSVDWPPDPHSGAWGFDELETQRAFEPYLEELVGAIRFPAALPTPLPES